MYVQHNQLALGSARACPTGFVRDPVGGTCVCPEGSAPVKGPDGSITCVVGAEYKSGDNEDDGDIKKPWYKNKWVWIGTAVVLVAGGGAAVAYSRRSR